MNLIEFLKTHTKINNDFIDDFFGLYDSNDKYLLEDIKKVVRRVAHTPFVAEVRNTRSVLY